MPQLDVAPRSHVHSARRLRRAARCWTMRPRSTRPAPPQRPARQAWVCLGCLQLLLRWPQTCKHTAFSSVHAVHQNAPLHRPACAGPPQAEVIKAAVGRLFDEQESVRKAAMAAVAALLQVRIATGWQQCSRVQAGGLLPAGQLQCCLHVAPCLPQLIPAAAGGACSHASLTCCPPITATSAAAQAHPELAGSKATEGRGSVLSCLLARLRDKKAGARREAASQAAAVMRAWVLASAADPSTAPRQDMILGIPLVLCNLAVRDTELGAHILDVVFRAGIYPAKLPPADVARYWALLWRQAGERLGGGWEGLGRQGFDVVGTVLVGLLAGSAGQQPLPAGCHLSPAYHPPPPTIWLSRRGGAASALQDSAGGDLVAGGWMGLCSHKPCAATRCVHAQAPGAQFCSVTSPPCCLVSLQGKAAVQGRVQELLALRAAAKEARTSSLAGAGRCT